MDHSRHLLAGGGSCKKTEDWEKVGGLIGYFVGVFFMFLGIAIVCDDFFVASLEQICNVLDLSDDIAGATFMAAGSSAPELASSAMSLLNPNAGSEIGVGTIVGSAIFNILVIIGATVCATGNTLQLDWKPVTRDCFFYAAAIAGIVGTFQDGKTEWWEGAIYVACYGGYILTMKYNVQLMKWMDKMAGGDGSKVKKGSSFAAREGEGPSSSIEVKSITIEEAPKSEDPNKIVKELVDAAVAKVVDMAEGRPKITALKSEEMKSLQKLGFARSLGSGTSTGTGTSGKDLWNKIKKKQTFADVVLSMKQQKADEWKAKVRTIGEEDAEDANVHKLTPTLSAGHIRAYRHEATKVAHALKRKEDAAAAAAKALEEGTAAPQEDPEDEEDDESPFSPPEEMKDYPLWLLSLPWYAAFSLTVPPCESEKWRKWYMVSFFMSIAWIGFITHWMVEWCVRIGCILNIPAVVMGTTVLAAGTSIPDALSSIAVAKDGLADMAVANAVGSNVFDIWLGLGLPWLCYLSWQSPSYILVNTTELVPSSLILAGVLVLYYGSVATNGFRLTVKMGYVFMATYCLYALYSIILVWLLDIYDLSK